MIYLKDVSETEEEKIKTYPCDICKQATNIDELKIHKDCDKKIICCNTCFNAKLQIAKRKDKIQAIEELIAKRGEE